MKDTEYEALKLNMREVLDSSAGRAVLWFLLESSALYSVSFTGNSQTYFNEGVRSMGLRLLGLIDDTDPTAYPRMLLEQAKRNEVNDGK